MAHITLRRAKATLIGIVAIMSLILVPPTASASGGGGCGRQVTDAEGVVVTIRQFCFGPTILRVAPGETVSWVNMDAAPHNVLGANGVWGEYSKLKRTTGVTYRFVRSGVYPYVCTYHTGMVGAVVVGDGTGLGSVGTTTVEGPVATVEPSTETQNVAIVDVARPVETRTSLGAWPAGAGAALVLASIAGMAWRARRRRVTTGAP